MPCKFLFSLLLKTFATEKTLYFGNNCFVPGEVDQERCAWILLTKYC